MPLHLHKQERAKQQDTPTAAVEAIALDILRPVSAILAVRNMEIAAAISVSFAVRH